MNSMVGFTVVFSAEEKRDADHESGTGLADPPNLSNHRVEISHVLQNVRRQDFVEVILWKRPWIVVEVTELISSVINHIQICPARANIRATPYVETTRFGSVRRCAHEIDRRKDA